MGYSLSLSGTFMTPRLLALLVSIPLALASHERNRQGGAHNEPGGIIIGVIIAAFVTLLVVCVLWKSCQRLDDMSYISSLLALATMLLQTVSALCVALLSFRCGNSCSMNLLVSGFVIVPVQGIASILGLTGCGVQLSLRRYPDGSYSPCCCGSRPATAATASSFNGTAIFFVAVSIFTMIVMNGNYNTGREGPALVVLLCFAEIVRIVMLVACIVCAQLCANIPVRQTTSPDIAMGVPLDLVDVVPAAPRPLPGNVTRVSSDLARQLSMNCPSDPQI